ncbi:hypothetical protein BDU57DRAFT_521701 [Ampelomyces quisqualis]|uniref:Uncharacterized protein n=1 Tax=Ampelomyces quisqualis TaxID=50730 RepID=A0A6A5QE14_AMPQU|nr:hypothetical protein BDU57DRAFT_521701 [Ampelomyces quisqualis]
MSTSHALCLCTTPRPLQHRPPHASLVCIARLLALPTPHGLCFDALAWSSASAPPAIAGVLEAPPPSQSLPLRVVCCSPTALLLDVQIALSRRQRPPPARGHGLPDHLAAPHRRPFTLAHLSGFARRRAQRRRH